MLRSLHHLNRSILPDYRGEVSRQRHLRQADRAVVQRVAGTGDAEHGLHDQGVVLRHRAFAQVDVDESAGVALEPARLDTHGAAGHGPFGAVVGQGHASTFRREGNGQQRCTCKESREGKSEGGVEALHGYIHCMP